MKYKKNNMFQKTIDGLSREEASYFWSYINDLKSDAGRVRNMKKNERRLNNKIVKLQTKIDKAIEMFDNENLNKYYSGMSYEFEIDNFKKDLLDILRGEE